MVESNYRKKISLISLTIIFLIVILITILLLKNTNLNLANNEDILNLKTIDTPENIASKKAEIKSYVSDIKEVYGINVIYGADTINYASNVNATPQNDLNIIDNNVIILFHTLQKYPQTMFNDFKNKKDRVDIVILDRFSNDNIALASKNNLNEVKLYISNNEKVERSLHHELFHIFEYCMQDKNKNVFKDWENLNPQGFKYESNISSLDSKYVYLKDIENSTENNKYFVTKYAKASPKEDRAETFAELMMITKIPDYLTQDTNIRKKANYILKQMSNYYDIHELYFNKIVKID